MKSDGVWAHLTALDNVQSPHAARKNLAASWRRALERAQWEGRLRYEGRPDQPQQEEAGALGAAVVVSTLRAVPDHQADNFTLPVTTPETHAPTSPAQGEIQGFSKDIAVTSSRTTGQRSGLHGWEGRARIAPAHISQRGRIESAGIERVTLQWSEWLSKVVHLSVHGNQVRISIRDRALGGTQAQLLAQRIAAELREAGWEMTELTVNGQRVLGKLPETSILTRNQEE